MTTAREEIAAGTRESIHDWGFPVLIVHADGSTQPDVMANGRKHTEQISAEGLPVTINKPYLSISIDDLTTIPDKGDMVQAPADFFRPGAPSVWYKIDNSIRTDDDWFVKIYLTKTKQEPAA